MSYGQVLQCGLQEETQIKTHKKACERRAAEIAAELYDEKLFKEVEPEECPICLLPLPYI